MIRLSQPLSNLMTWFAVTSIVALSRGDCVMAQQVLAEKASFTMETEELWCQYAGTQGPGVGRHVVLLSGDEEYRSEESMPMLGQILAKRYGFKCTVLFAVDPDSGEINPDNQNNIPGIEMLDNADLVILGLRYRQLPDDQMKHFADYVDSYKPIVAYRTSTHAFAYDKDSASPYKKFGNRQKEPWEGGFGQKYLGDTWIAHHGHHAVESTLAVHEKSKAAHPVLTGVDTIWGPTDVYAITHLPDSASVLMRGTVLAGMSPDDKPAAGKKNDPMMPVAWTMIQESPTGAQRRVFCTTMGAATDFVDEDLRRLVVNASFWCLQMEPQIPSKANVDFVSAFNPTDFGFHGFKKGVKPSDHQVDISDQ